MSGDGKTKRLTRVYIEGALPSLQQWQLPEEVAHYVTRVLRHREGDHLICFDDQGQEGEFALLSLAKGREAWVESLGEMQQVSPEGSLAIHVACSLSKGNKLDEVIRRICELGAASFTPLTSLRSIPRGIQEEKRLKRWQKIAGEAARQSGRTPMNIEPFCSFQEYVSERAGEKIVLWAGASASPSLGEVSAQLHEPEVLHVLIGPEGGWDVEEIQLASRLDCHLASLGPRILRAETAPVAVVSILQALLGDMK